MVIEDSVLIDASIEGVWDTFTDLTCWKNWCTILEGLSSDHKQMTEGARFKCSIRPFDIPLDLEPVIEEVVLHRRIVWSASRQGISARHEFTFEQKGDKVLVTSRETFSGLFMNPIRFLFPKKKIKKLSGMMLNEVKEEAERNSLSLKEIIVQDNP